MAKSSSLQNKISRRTLMVAGGQILLGSALVGRMAYLQIWQADHYKTLSKGNCIKIDPIVPPRGLILDRSHNIIANNTKMYRAVLTKDALELWPTTFANLQQLIKLPDINFLNFLQWPGKEAKNFFVLKENLTWDEVTTLEVHQPDLPGVMVEAIYNRYYDLEDVGAHLMGYTQNPSVEDVAANSLYKINGIIIGKSGIEKTQNSKLEGKPGYREIEVNARRQTIRELKVTPYHSGQDITLTIDRRLQEFVHNRLAQEKSASAVVLDIHSGAVLALSSFPSFNPNLFTAGIGSANWKQLIDHPEKPLLNKAIGGEYPPGSLFKLVVALAALKEGIISVDKSFTCPGHLEISGHRFHCVRSYGHGRLNLVQAITQSCDVYFYELALKIGIENIAKTSHLLGLGQQTGIELPHERSGIVPNKAWKKKRFGRSWMIGETVLAGIGQGYMSATPLQMALLMARIANGGVPIKPHLIAGGEHARTQSDFSPTMLAPLMEATSLAINKPGGTGYRSRIVDSQLAMGGKTSTAQVRRISAADRKLGKHRQSQPWQYRDHSIFAGYAPVHKPQFSVSVVVEHGGWGSVAAAPLARDLLLKTQQLM